MTAAAHPRAQAASAAHTRAADVLVVFGITGDLAKVMTFLSLYRLERRGLLDCPIVGVAGDDWTVDDLRERARTSIETAGGEPVDDAVFERLAARLSYVGGDFGEADTYARLARELGDAQQPGLLPRDPAVAVRDGHQGPVRRRADRDRARGRREALRPRPRVGAGAGRRDPPVHRRVPALPDRPLPREDGPRRRSSTCASPTRCSSRSGTATTSRRCRSRWPRASASRTAATSTTRSARCATSWSTT